MELCHTPELACEVTMQPIDELGVDAAILFSDILVPLEAMGQRVWFDGGPQLAPPVRSAADVDRLRVDGVADDLSYVYDAVRLIKAGLASRGDLPLLGFAGAPWTLASYAIEGSSSRNHHELKRMMFAEPAALHALLQKLATVVAAYLRRQIEAGADAVQLFDTWGSLLGEARWREFSMQYTAQIMEALADTGVPIIHYVKGYHLLAAAAELPCQVLSVDWTTPLDQVRAHVGNKHALQGNIDPAILRAPADVIEAEVRACLASHPWPGHIFNLGHGITPDATVETVRHVVDCVKRYGGQAG